MKPRLAPSSKATLRRASREAVEESLAYLKRHFKHERWIGIGNRYRTNTIDKIFADTRPGRILNHFQLTQYIAASAPLHCADGWSLLGRAIDCHARRDHESARHFAYYAQLRAAVSLLAAEGIGIFDRNHFVVETPTQCNKFGGSTHKITWQAIEYWGELKRSSDLLGRSIRVNGIALEEWLSHFPAHASLRAVGKKWLRTWGLDLRLLAEDQDFRNEASYRPTKLTRRLTLDADASADFMCAVWSLCEPSAHAPFNRLDKHLLRLALEETFRGVRGTTASASRPQFKSDITGMLSTILTDRAAQNDWLGFLTRATEPDDPVILFEARQPHQADDPRQHLQMVSRAALLLRIATAANARLLQEAHVSGADVKFWWSALGEERGLWAKGEQPANLTDLWADVEGAVKNITEWQTKTAPADRGFVQWRQNSSSDISVLGGCERIGLWGLEL